MPNTALGCSGPPISSYLVASVGSSADRTLPLPNVRQQYGGNAGLAQARAEAVKQFLIGFEGSIETATQFVDPGEVFTMIKGPNRTKKTDPRAPEDDRVVIAYVLIGGASEHRLAQNQIPPD